MALRAALGRGDRGAGAKVGDGERVWGPVMGPGLRGRELSLFLPLQRRFSKLFL